MDGNWKSSWVTQLCFEIGGVLFWMEIGGLGRIHRRYQTPLCSTRRPSDFMARRRGSKDMTDTGETEGTESL